jgi:tripartite ATP-independent transporter DctM subunit
MDANTILVFLMFFVFIAFLSSGYPIAFCLGGTAILFAGIGYLSDLYLGTLTGIDYMAVGMMVNRIYRTLTNWLLVAVPMFIFMGLMLDKSVIAERMMKSIQNLFGKVNGGLAITVVFIGIILGASTGIIGASVVLMGLISLPAMLKQGYSKTLALGSICSAGTLGILIPPSVMLVIMADNLEVSVGDLFMGALIPGIMLGIMYIIYILIYGFFKPEAVPLSQERAHLDLRMVFLAFRDILPPGLLILLVLGSIFAGMATVTEASGVGAMGTVLLAWFSKKLNFQIMKEVLYTTFHVTSYVFGLLIGATCFALVLRFLGGDEVIEGMLVGFGFGPYGILAVIVGAIFVLGFFLDWIEITLIILPLVSDIIPKLGFAIEGYGVVANPSLVWFAIVVAITLQTSFLTPPVGFALFYLKGVCPPEIRLLDIYKGVIPFIILQLLGLTITILWPQLVLWLPAFVYR